MQLIAILSIYVTNITSTGEKHGIAFLLDVCKSNDGPTGSHFLVPKSVIDSQQPEDLAYLWAKGAFSMPTEEACEGLLQCYFRYVHPFLPVIDVSNFLSQYANGGPRRISSLLLWSMFSAASNVSPIYPAKLYKAN